MAKIAASMAEFGWTQPVLVAADGEVVAGHGRILAAERLGLDRAPVIVLGHLDEAERRAYRIADNQLTELGGWDEELLAGELKELAETDFDLSLIGFADGELGRLLALDPEGDGDGADSGTPPVVPEPPSDPVSRMGDLWLLGDHRLLCGDSTDPAQVRRLHAMEIGPAYVDVAILRWQAETGHDAVLDGDGRTLAEVAAEREGAAVAAA